MKTLKDLAGATLTNVEMHLHTIGEAINTDAMLQVILDNQIKIRAKLEGREIKDVAAEVLKELSVRRAEAEDSLVSSFLDNSNDTSE